MKERGRKGDVEGDYISVEVTDQEGPTVIKHKTVY